VDATDEQHSPRVKRRFHRRVAHLPLCQHCVERIAARRRPPGELQPSAAERWSLVLAYGGLLLHALFYALMFWWASRSDTGSAALQGVVAADVLSFLGLGAFKIVFDGLEITVDGMFQFVLVVLFLNRDALFSIDKDAEFAGTSFLFFLAFVAVRLGVWGAEQATGAISGT